MISLTDLFNNNLAWAKSCLEIDPKYFVKLAKDQTPDIFWIGCSDSRILPNEIIGVAPGNMLVHRNIANLVVHTDFNILSALQFAVDVLDVSHVIICGHYDCGGVQAAIHDTQLGIIDNWTRHIRDTYAFHKEELYAIDDLHARHDRLCELNVIQQVNNISHTTVVQNAWAAGRSLQIHGWVYSLDTGLIKDLKCSVQSSEQIEEIYRTKK